MRPRGRYSPPTQPCIAEPVERREDRRVVDLAFVRLVPRRNGRDLHMADQRQVLFEPADEIAADDLRMIEIELDAQIRPLRPWR